MNSWLLLRRLRGPSYIILAGITALLHQWHILSFGRSWPLYLILAGIFGLAERWVIVAAPPAPTGYPAAWEPQPYAPAYPTYSQSSPSATPQSAPSPNVDPLADPDRRS
jgi:hypothetical protein